MFVPNEINEVDSSLQERYNFLEKLINDEIGYDDPSNEFLHCAHPEWVERAREDIRCILHQTISYLSEEPKDDYDRKKLGKGRRR